LWERLFELKERGVTLILTTHYMDEAEQLCDRLVVMDSGLIVAEGTPRELIDKHVGSEIVELRFSAGDRSSGVSLVQRISRRHTEDRVQVLPDRTVVYTDRGDEVVAAVHAHGITPASSIVRRTTLEDVFLTLTGHGLSD
jgi:lipooligosaccharide transport system ATP-binding protein